MKTLIIWVIAREREKTLSNVSQRLKSVKKKRNQNRKSLFLYVEEKTLQNSWKNFLNITITTIDKTFILKKQQMDTTKEKCRKFLANLLELSSREPKAVERNVRTLIQELIDAKVEPEDFCDRLEKLLNASPQPCLIGFLKVCILYFLV